MATMGRPREFDLNDALDRAIEVFWRNGYEGASVAELCEAMGIKPPSLYAAFENKAGLFRHALDRYLERRVGYWDEALEAPSAREMVERLVRGCVDFLSEEGKPPGCLFVRSAAVVQRGDRLHPAGAGGAPRRGRGQGAGAPGARGDRGRAAAGPRSRRIHPLPHGGAGGHVGARDRGREPRGAATGRGDGLAGVAGVTAQLRAGALDAPPAGPFKGRSG